MKMAKEQRPPVADEPIRGDATEDDSFPPQWRYIISPALRNVVKSARRTGKTQGIIRRASRRVVREKNVLYVGRVLKNVRQQFWIPFKDRFSRLGVDFKTQEQDLVLRREGGGMLMGMSADDVKDVEKGRGYNWDLAIIDEAQSFPPGVLETLIDYILIPTLIDTGGALDMDGTPPDPKKGEATDGLFVKLILEAMANRPANPRTGWHLHEWNMFDNPFIDPVNITEGYASRGIGPGHPIWEAEVMGRLVQDPANRVFPYDEKRNTFTEIPK